MALTFIQRIKEFFTGRRDFKTGTRIAISCEALENRVSVMEAGQLEDYQIERVGHSQVIGSIYKGKIKNIEQGLKAMFVDIGQDKNAFLHFWDAIPAAIESGFEEVQRGKGKGKGKSQKKTKIEAKDIPTLYPVGSEIMVQVTKGPIGNKGPRVTTNISLAGRLLVLMPLNDQCGISRKIDDPKERARLRDILEKVDLPDGMGVILRTEAMGKRARHIIRDLHILIQDWEKTIQVRDNKKAPVCCFQEPDLITRTVRDYMTDEVDEVLCDDKAMVERMQQEVGEISRRWKRRITHFTGPGSLYDYHGIQKQVDNAFYRQVWLPCGGYIVIDQTEALVAIDVNTGRNKGKDVDKLLLETNMEAAAEVARQLRLRNMGGLVVVDFIDMKHRRDQQAVYKLMLDKTKKDKAKTQILQISQFGLMEMTRQRLNESLESALFEPCPTCKGHGLVKTPITMSVDIQRKLSAILQKGKPEQKDLTIVVQPDVMDRLRREDAELLAELQRKYQCKLAFRVDPAFTREQYKIVHSTTGSEITA